MLAQRSRFMRQFSTRPLRTLLPRMRLIGGKRTKRHLSENPGCGPTRRNPRPRQQVRIRTNSQASIRPAAVPMIWTFSLFSRNRNPGLSPAGG
jgi:hypothetical protein